MAVAKKKVAKKVTKKAPKKVAKKKAPAKKRVTKKSKRSSVYDLEERRLEENQTSSGSSSFWKPKGEGRWIIRPVTYLDESGTEKLFAEQRQHWGVDPENAKSSVMCGGDNCPICDLKDEVPSKIWDKVKVQRKMLVNLIIREGGLEGDDIFKVYPMPISAYKKLSNLLKELRADGEDPLCPNSGIDFRLTRSGRSFQDTEYNVLPMRDTSDLGMEVEPKNLDLYVQVPDEQDLVEVANKIVDAHG